MNLMNQQVSFVQLESLLMNLVVADKNFVSVSCALARTPSSSPNSDRILGRAQFWNMTAFISRNAVRDEHMWKIRFYMSDWSLDDSFSLKKPWGDHSLISINMQRCLEKLKMRIGNGALINACNMTIDKVCTIHMLEISKWTPQIALKISWSESFNFWNKCSKCLKLLASCLISLARSQQTKPK